MGVISPTDRQAGQKVCNNSRSIFNLPSCRNFVVAGAWWHANRKNSRRGAGMGVLGINAALSGLEVLGGKQPEGKAGFL